MKAILSTVILICILILSACGSVYTSSGTLAPIKITASPAESAENTDAPSESIIPLTETADTTETTQTSDDTEEDITMVPFDASDMDKSFIKDAKKYRTTLDGYEHYFDTSKPVVEKDLEDEQARPDFPLMKKKKGKSKGVFAGVYGDEFQTKNGFIYITSGDFVAGDWESWKVSALSLKDGKVTGKIDDASLYFPSSGERIYYTQERGGNNIFSCKPDLTDIEKLIIHLPDWDSISAKLMSISYDQATEEGLDFYIGVLKISDGWIYFTDEVFYSPDFTAYMGGYRMSLDGTKIEKTDKGEFPWNSYD